MPITKLQWPFRLDTSIAGINYFDLDRVSSDMYPNIVGDNDHALAFNCNEYTFNMPSGTNKFIFRTDPKTGNLVGFQNGHGGTDLYLPIGTEIISPWNVPMVMYNDRVVTLVLNNDTLRLSLHHVKPVYPLSQCELRPQHRSIAGQKVCNVKAGEKIATIERGRGGEYTYPTTGRLYAELHLEVEILDEKARSGWSTIEFNTGKCNPNPMITFDVPVERLDFINGFPDNPFK